MEEAKLDWVKIKPAEMEKLVMELAQMGHTSQHIGLILRDNHGIPKAKLIGKKINQIITEAKIVTKTEKDNISRKIEVLNAHLAKNKQDYGAKRALTRQMWAIEKSNF